MHSYRGLLIRGVLGQGFPYIWLTGRICTHTEVYSPEVYSWLPYIWFTGRLCTHTEVSSPEVYLWFPYIWLTQRICTHTEVYSSEVYSDRGFHTYGSQGVYALIQRFTHQRCTRTEVYLYMAHRAYMYSYRGFLTRGVLVASIHMAHRANKTKTAAASAMKWLQSNMQRS
jgi:hypothetical protein